MFSQSAFVAQERKVVENYIHGSFKTDSAVLRSAGTGSKSVTRSDEAKASNNLYMIYDTVFTHRLKPRTLHS